MAAEPLRAPRGDEAELVLKLHGGERRDQVSLTADMTVPEFYRAFFRPIILVAQGAEVRTLAEYDQSIDYWERFTERPTLRQVNDYDIGSFMTRVSALPGKGGKGSISPNTIRKHCTHLQAVLIKAGPRSHERHRRKAQSLIPEVPYFEKPREREKVAEDDFAIDEIGKLMSHCAAAVAPAYLQPRERTIWWQKLFLFDFNVGLRIGSVLLVRWDKFKPDAQGRAWVYVRVKRGHERKFFCNASAMACIESMRPLTGNYEYVWHWPHNQRWLQEQRRRILAAADFPADRCFGFHGLRKAMCTVVSEYDPFAAQMQADHTDMAMTQKRYINPKRVANAMSQVPQPKVPTPQRRLFE